MIVKKKKNLLSFLSQVAYSLQIRLDDVENQS